jgi:hypothetical protein
MIYQSLFFILLIIMTVVLGGPFITKAMSNAIDMQLKMQQHQRY